MIASKNYALEETGAMTKVGELIDQARERLGISQNQLAAKAGIGSSGISKIVSGDVQPTMKSLEKIARALNIDIQELWKAANEDLLTRQSKMHLDTIKPEDKEAFLEALREEIEKDDQLFIRARKWFEKLRGS